ncbi:MAG TPA: FtsX-like permease family protein, partial [Dehalococcoidia bacterium]|nr:FtsX-like permease family protein [Dehalococcoidia bacterium]
TIEEWSPIIVRPMGAVGVEVDDAGTASGETDIDIHLIGYDAETGMSGPLTIKDGAEAPGDGEVIIDDALGSRFGLGIGDRIEAAGRQWEITGISAGGNFVGSQTVFAQLDDVQEALSMGGLATFVGIRTTEGTDPAVVASAIESADSRIVAFTKDEFAESTREEVLGNLIPILTMILVLAFIVGLSVAGLTIYTSTVEKAREYGILKAVGFKNSYLYRLVFEQSMVIGAIGFVIGAGGTILFSPFATDLVPQFVTLVQWQDILLVLGATVVMSVVAGYVPVRRLATIDPTSVFKA